MKNMKKYGNIWKKHDRKHMKKSWLPGLREVQLIGTTCNEKLRG
jgi:hypothetical protein